MPATVRDRTAYGVIGLLSTGVIGFLFWLIYLKVPAVSAPAWADSLPALNALLNGLSAGFVTVAIVAIRRGHPRIHIGLICGGLVFSGLFLVSYITHHAIAGDTLYSGEGWLRTVYFAVLISHILLSMLVVPMILATVFFALTGRWSRHRGLARITFPVWIYVSVTGVAVYFFLHG